MDTFGLKGTTCASKSNYSGNILQLQIKKTNNLSVKDFVGKCCILFFAKKIFACNVFPQNNFLKFYESACQSHSYFVI